MAPNVDNIINNRPLSTDPNENAEMVKYAFTESSDLIYYGIKTRFHAEVLLVYIEEIINTEVLNRDIIRPMVEGDDKAISVTAEGLRNHMPITDVKKASDLSEVAKYLVLGKTIMFIKGLTESLVLPTEKWEKRSLSEPESEVSSKGPRVGFIEDFKQNKALLRKRIMNNDLVFDDLVLGRQTKTLVSVGYVKGIVNTQILCEVKRRLNEIDIDEVLDASYIQEMIKDAPLSPFNTVGYTERPESVASKLLEGRICIICNGSPLVLTVPYLFLENFQTSEDYNNHFFVASFVRLIRIMCFILTVFTPGIYLALVAFHQEMIPAPLLISFIASRSGVPFPSYMEVIIMLFVFDLIRESGLRLPRALGQTVSIVGALVLGQAAVDAKFVSAPVVIIVAVTAIASFVFFRINGAVIMYRMFILILGAILGRYGVIFGAIILLLQMMSIRSFGIMYMSYLGTFRQQEYKDTIIRLPWWYMKVRPLKIARGNKVREK